MPRRDAEPNRDTTRDSTGATSSLELARRIEGLASEASQVRSVFRSTKGGEKICEARKRARKQLSKLIDVLESLQRTILATEPTSADRRQIEEHLESLDRMLEDAPMANSNRAGIEQLRERVRSRRRKLRDYI